MCWRGHGNGWYSVSWGDRGAGIRPAGSGGDSRRPPPASDRPAPAGGRQFGKNHAARGDRNETCGMTCAIEYGFSPAPRNQVTRTRVKVSAELSSCGQHAAPAILQEGNHDVVIAIASVR